MTILSSVPITQSAAHDFLAAYLDRATTDPALQPNAAISEHGPVSRTTAAAPNLILHNLKRVQAGLAGEVLGRDLSLVDVLGGGSGGDAEEGEQGLLEGQGQGQQRLRRLRGKGAEVGAEEWQDAEQWQQTNTGVTTTPITGEEEDDDDGGDGAREGENENEDEDEEDGYGETKLQTKGEHDDPTISGADRGATIDKEERKRKKKERRLAEKRAKSKKSA